MNATDTTNAIRGIRNEIDSLTLYGSSMRTALLILADALEDSGAAATAHGMRILANEPTLLEALYVVGNDDMQTALLCGGQDGPHYTDNGRSIVRYCIGRKLFHAMNNDADETQERITFHSPSHAILELAFTLSFVDIVR